MQGNFVLKAVRDTQPTTAPAGVTEVKGFKVVLIRNADPSDSVESDVSMSEIEWKFGPLPVGTYRAELHTVDQDGNSFKRVEAAAFTVTSPPAVEFYDLGGFTYTLT